MQGRQDYQPKLFTVVDVESLIPKSHFLRRLSGVLDLSFIRAKTAPLYCSTNGRPSIDPEVFFRMLLVGYFYGIRSDRQLCEEVGYNLCYRWFCRLSLEDSIPDHSSLTRIRDRLGEETFKFFFDHVLSLCETHGLVQGERIVADGTLIRADASKKSMVKKDPHDPTDYGKKDGPTINNDNHVSKTDPEATMMGKLHEPKRLCYRSHTAIDGDSRVIVDCHVTTGSIVDAVAFQDRIETLRQERELPVTEVIADRGFGSTENLRYLKDNGIEAFIPLYTTRAGQCFGKEREKGFILDPVLDSMTCPAGHLMTETKPDTIHRRFRMDRAICQACPQYVTCVSERQRADNRGKLARVHRDQAIMDEALEKEKTKPFRKKMKERMWKIEGIFGEAKVLHGLSRAKYRGRKKVQIQVYMTASVQNLKRLLIAVLWFLDRIQFGAEKVLGIASRQLKISNFSDLTPIIA